MKKNFILIFIVILFSIPAIAALFNPGFFQSDDGEWMIIRFSAFHQAFRDGQFPVRFLDRLNYGYGYPVANFLYPGFMYLGEIFKLLGFGFVETVKIILGLSMISSAVFAYLWLSKLFDKFSGFIGSLFYLYAPYHLFDLYKRGSVGEVLSLSIAPFILWQLERKSFFWSSIGIGLLIISHNTLSIMFVGLIFVYMIFDIYISKDKKNLIKKYLLTLLIGLGTSAFFWLPAFLELPNTVFFKTQISEWDKYFTDFNLIGMSTIFVFLIIFFFFITSKIQIKKHRLTVLLFALGLISIFFASPISYIFWKVLPVSFIQFPFRFLSISILCTAFLSSVLINQLKGTQRIIGAVFLSMFLIISAVSFIRPTIFFDKGNSYYSTNEDSTTVKNEYMPIWVKENPKDHFAKKVDIENGEIKDLKIKSGKINFSTSSMDNSNATINTVYFPGWNLTVDGREYEIDYKNKGLIEFKLQKGEHNVVASFSETPIRIVSNVISLASLFFLILFSVL